MNTTDELRALLDEWKTIARRDAAHVVPRLVAAVEAVLDKERKPDPDTWDLWDWGYDIALDEVAGLIRAALTGDDEAAEGDQP